MIQKDFSSLPLGEAAASFRRVVAPLSVPMRKETGHVLVY